MPYNVSCAHLINKISSLRLELNLESHERYSSTLATEPQGYCASGSANALIAANLNSSSPEDL